MRTGTSTRSLLPAPPIGVVIFKRGRWKLQRI